MNYSRKMTKFFKTFSLSCFKIHVLRKYYHRELRIHNESSVEYKIELPRFKRVFTDKPVHDRK